MIIDCEKIRITIEHAKEDKRWFDKSCIGEVADWDFVALRQWRIALGQRLDFLRGELKFVKGYKFIVSVVMASVGEPKDFEGARKKVLVEGGLRGGEKIRTIVVKDILNLKRVENLDGKIPENMTVMENIFLQGSDITELPKGLVVGGNLHINNSKIKKLPDDLMVHI
jgi:hypothetical protein